MLRPQLFFCIVLALLLASAPARAAVSDEDIQRAITKLKTYFYKTQAPDGTWEHLYAYKAGHEIPNKGGATALITLAMLYAGESPQNPRLAPTVKYLRTEKMTGCYSRSFRAHIWAHMPDEYLPLLRADVDWLVNVANDDLTFPHPVVGELANLIDPETGKRKGPVYYDNSITQYGHLALWEALKRDAAPYGNAFRQMADYWMRAQGTDGGWGYSDKEEAINDAYGSMTAAGVTCLIIAQQGLQRTLHAPDPKVSKAIEKGIAWLDKRFDGMRCMGNSADRRQYDIYYTVCLERAALAGGLSTLNGKDWFRTCAEELVKKVMASPDGNVNANMQVADSAFVLMFLARGRVPVWMTKLQVEEHKWNQHPNEVFFLNEFISHRREGEVNWQSVPLEKDPDEWLFTPIAYLSSPDALKLSDAQKKNLKKYIDRGGMLVFNPVDRSAAFTSSVKKLAEEFYPQHKMRPLEANHPLFSVLHKIDQPQRHNILGVSNGARELILLMGTDIGYQWQAEGAQKGGHWDLSMNLFCLATNKGELRNRLTAQFEPREKKETKGDILVGRGRYVGNWLPEPESWALLSNDFHNRTGLEIKTQDVDLAALASSGLKFVHLAGTQAVKLTAEQLAGIKSFVLGGGTVLVETIGGNGNFAQEIEKQLAAALERPAGPLGSTFSIVTGEGLEGAYNCRQVSWRWRTAQMQGIGHQPRLWGIPIDDAARVIISQDDLSLGVMGVRQWHTLGYSPESSRKLLTNMLLASQVPRK